VGFAEKRRVEDYYLEDFVVSPREPIKHGCTIREIFS